MLRGSEAIYGFLGWLTSRDKEVTLSSKSCPGDAAELAQKFIDTNKLGELRDDWVKYLTHPKD